MPLTQDLLRLKEYRSSNPQLTDMSDTQLADLVNRQTGELGDLKKSSAIGRVVARGSNVLHSAGEATESALKPVLGDSYPGKVAARATNLAIQNAPEFLINALAARVLPQSKMGTVGLGALNFGLGYGRGAVETGDQTAALSQGAGNVASMIGAMAGAKIGHAKGGKVGGAVGGFVGGQPGAAIAIAGQPGGFEEFLKDPLNLPATILSQLPYAAIDHVQQKGIEAKLAREKNIADTPSLDQFDKTTPAQELIRLSKIPVSQLSEQTVQRIRELQIQLGRAEEANLGKKERNVPTSNDPSYDTVPESRATIIEQIKMMNKGKKPAVMFTSGTKIPPIPFELQPTYKVHETPEGYFMYNEKLTNPDAINDAIKSNTLGSILGYGIPSKPLDANGYTMVLRNRKGVEKLAVVTSDTTQQAVAKHLQSLAEPGDVIQRESNVDVVERRLADRGNIKTYSLSVDPKQYTSDQPAGTLSRLYTDYFLDRVGAKDTNEVRLPHWIKNDGVRESLVNPPADFVRYAESRGVKVRQQAAQKEVQGALDLGQNMYAINAKNFFQNTLLKNLERAFTKTEKKGARFQLDENGDFSSKAALKAIEQYVPKAMFEHYKSVGLEEFLKTSRVKSDLAAYQRTSEGFKKYIDQPDKFQENFAENEKIKNRYEGMPPTTSSVSDKVNYKALSEWISENTPKIEVKQLKPRDLQAESEAQQKVIQTERDYNAAQHLVEGLGFQLSDASTGFRVGALSKNGIDYVEQGGYVYEYPHNENRSKVTHKLSEMPKEVQNYFEKLEAYLANAEREPTQLSDAATGRYGVEPINVEEMDRPVDILVRVPTTETAKGRDLPREGSALFVGPHFGDSDRNVLASIRGYFKGDTFYVFEVQSDWGQTRARQIKDYPPNDLRFQPVKGHPLLTSYETLAVKAAIQHALENGATKIAFSDSKTAMMIEGHDRGNLRFDPVNSPDSVFGTSPQEAGMKQHYDHSLPAIASRLTGDSGKLFDLGRFTTRTPSEYFGGKDNITARVYDITNLKPEVENLFALYGQEDQHNFVENLSKAETAFEQQILAGKDVTSEQFIDAITSGENVDKAIMLKYLSGLVGGHEKLRTFLGDAVNGITPEGVTTGLKVAVSSKLTGEKALGTAAHELSHVASNLLKYTNKAAYDDHVAFPNSLTPETRMSIIQELHKVAGIEGADIAYLAGERFNKTDPNYQTKVAYEFYGALSETLGRLVYRDSTINLTVKQWFSWLPLGAQRWLSQLSGQFVKFFGPQYPSLRHTLSGDELKGLTEGYKKLLAFTHANESAQAAAYKQLQRLNLFEPANFIDSIPSLHDTKKWQPVMQSLGNQPEMMRDWSLNFLRESGIVKKTADAYEDWFMSPLFRTKLHPETTDFFRELHHYRNKIKDYEHGYLGFLGQNKENNLSPEQAIQNYHNYITTLISPFSKTRNVRLEAMSKIIQKNQDIRESILNPKDGKSSGSVKESDLVSREQMINEYKLSETDADFLQKLVKLPQIVAEQSLRFMQATDSVNLSKLFYLQNKNQDIRQVKAKVAELTRLSNDAGANALELEIMEKYYEQLKYNDPQNTQKHAELESRVFALKKQAEVYKALTEQAIRQSFSDSIQFQPEPGKDGFINQVSNVAVKLAKARAEQQFYMRDEGYAPMTRRGRFLVQVFKESIDGAALPGSTKLLKGFATKKEADAYRKANNLTDQNSKVMDKEMFAQRAELYTPRQLQAVRDKARADFDNLLREYSKSVPDTTPNKTELLAALSDIRNQFRPLDQEIKEVISAKGDKFKERRWMVDGFNELDFIPNIFEYTNYKTVVGQKALTRAEAELQTLRASVQANPAMVNRMHTELDYVLNHTNEMAGLRKMVFYNYLGASVRHMFQNLLQVPLNGVPEMVAQGAGFHAYGHSIKAAKLAALYAKDGTTGNKMFDVMLKQAEKEGVTIPSAIDFFAPESSELQNALDSITAQTSGVKEIGQKASYSGSVLWKNFEKFMRSTAVASETANRRVSFLMSLLESQRKGVTEPRKIFNDANVFTDYVNFVGDKSNRPGFQVKLGQTWAHGPVLLATAMQSFVFNHISQLYAYGKLAMKGDVNAKKAFVTGTAHLLTMAGVLGLPLAQNAEQLFEKVTGISLKEAVRQKLLLGAQELFDVDAAAGSRIADTVLNGFPKMLGIEASASVGLGDPLFHVQADQVPTAYQLAGPVGGVAEKLVQGVDAITANPWDGDSWMKATRTIAPQAINYWLKLADATMKGSYYDRGEAPVVEGLNGSSSVALALGFTPSEVANVRQVQKLRRNINDKLSTEYRTAVDAVAKALLAYQQKQSNENLLEANERFQKFLEKMAGTQDRDAMVKSITERLEELKHPTYLPPTLKESQPFREVLTSYPETKYPFREQLPQLFGELQVAQQLGQDDILARQVSGLKTSLMQKLLYDRLVQAGLEPWQASRISAGGRQASQQMSRTSLPQSQTP